MPMRCATDLDQLVGRRLQKIDAFEFDRPTVGSISRDRQRTSVDLPEPDRPMMMKFSPCRISSEARWTAPRAWLHSGPETMASRCAWRDIASRLHRKLSRRPCKPALMGDRLFRSAGRCARALGCSSSSAPSRAHLVGSKTNRNRSPLYGHRFPSHYAQDFRIEIQRTISPNPSTSPRWQRSRRQQHRRATCLEDRLRRDILFNSSVSIV